MNRNRIITERGSRELRECVMLVKARYGHADNKEFGHFIVMPILSGGAYDCVPLYWLTRENDTTYLYNFGRHDVTEFNNGGRGNQQAMEKIGPKWVCVRWDIVNKRYEYHNHWNA